MNAKLILIPFLIAIISIAYTSSDGSTTTSTTKKPEDKPKDDKLKSGKPDGKPEDGKPKYDKQGNNTLEEGASGNSTQLESNKSGNSTDDVSLQFGRPHFRNNKKQHRKKGKKSKKKHHKNHHLSDGYDIWGDDSEKLMKSLQQSVIEISAK